VIRLITIFVCATEDVVVRRYGALTMCLPLGVLQGLIYIDIRVYILSMFAN